MKDMQMARLNVAMRDERIEGHDSHLSIPDLAGLCLQPSERHRRADMATEVYNEYVIQVLGKHLPCEKAPFWCVLSWSSRATLYIQIKLYIFELR